MTTDIDTFRLAIDAIDFSSKFKQISISFHNGNRDELLKRIDKKIVNEIFNELGYKAKYYSYGDYVISVDDEWGYQYTITVNLKHGIMINHFGLSFKGQEIELPESNFGFIYRYHLNDMNAEITAPTFRNAADLKLLIKDIMNLFNEIVVEFSKRISEKL
jgi:hypothetical protein